MNKEEIEIKEFDKQQLELLLNDLQDIDKFTGFRDGAFKYELGKYQANLLVNCIKKYKEVIDKAINDLNIIIDIVREQPLGSDCWIIDRLNGFKIILEDKEVSE